MPERWELELSKLGLARPDTDLLRRARQGPMRSEPAPSRSGRRLTAAVVAFAVLVGCGVVLWWALGSVDRPPAFDASPKATANPGRFLDPAFGWSIDSPPGIEVRHFAENSLHEVIDGAMASNFDTSPTGPAGAPNMSGLRAFPPNGVALQIWALTFPPEPAPDNDSLPLPLASFERVDPYVGGDEPAPLFRGFSEDGFHYAVAMWIGPMATAADRSAIERTLDSLAFPRHREGTVWQHEYIVLGTADRYPVGTFTRIEASALPTEPGFAPPAPIFVVHSPAGFYVVRGQAQVGDSRCDVRFDPARSEFSCPGTPLEWTREGWVVGHPRQQEGSIGPYTVTEAIDGHLLYSPFWGGGVGVPDDLWPDTP